VRYSTFTTLRVAPADPGDLNFEPRVVAQCLPSLTRVRVRSLTGATAVATRLGPLIGKTGGELTSLPEAHVIPLHEADDFVVEPGEELYAMSNGPPFDVAVHRSALYGRQEGDRPQMRFYSTVLQPDDEPREIARAPGGTPVRVIVRLPFAGIGVKAACSVEEGDLRDNPLTCYQLLALPDASARELFVLGPGQVLLAVALVATPVPISVLRHEGVPTGDLIQLT
jgi:hypothetical protein